MNPVQKIYGGAEGEEQQGQDEQRHEIAARNEARRSRVVSLVFGKESSIVICKLSSETVVE